MRAGAFGGADDGAQVVRVGDLVAHDDERRFALFARGVQNIRNAHILAHGGKRDDALMGVRAAHEIKLALVRIHHDDALFARGGGNVTERAVGLTLLHVNFVNACSGAQRFDHGVATLDQTVRPGILLRRARSLGSGFFLMILTHKSDSLCKNSYRYKHYITTGG